MATIPLGRKLDISETLEHATEALAAHRAWMMKRRVQNFVSMSPLDEATVDRTAWALGGAPLAPNEGNF